MSIAIASIIALVIAVFISAISERNVGIMCMAFAYLIATFSGGALLAKDLAKFFPLGLFLMLVGSTFLFSMATINGTVEKLSKYAVKLTRGSVGMMPIVVYLLGVLISAAGPGNATATIVLAPIAMALSSETHISPFLMTIMIVTGVNAGAFSPISSTGIIGIGLADKIGLPGLGLSIFTNVFTGSTLVAVFAYVVLGGLKFWGAKVDAGMKERVRGIIDAPIEPLNKKQIITIAGLTFWMIMVLFFKWDVGYTAMLVAVSLSLLNVADEQEAIKKQPWSIMLMLAGVMVLVDVCAKTGGLGYATNAIVAISTPTTVSAVYGFINGFVSAYSSSSAVVMPTFTPLIPDLITKLGVVGPAALEMKKNMLYAGYVSAHLVDASPLSAMGAYCLSVAPLWADKNKLFRNLFIWGFAMCFVGAIVSFILW